MNTILASLYGPEYKNSAAQSNVSSIAFVGQVVGILIFGWTSDHWSRKWSLFISTIVLIIFAALGAGAYGANDSIYGLFAALTAYRFLLGIGIGGEYPAGSVASGEFEDSPSRHGAGGSSRSLEVIADVLYLL